MLFALPSPVAAISTKYCHDTPITLHLREKAWSLSGDDFSLKDANTGKPVFRIDGSVFSMSDRKTLFDASGARIVHVCDEMFSFTPQFNVYGSGSKALFSIRAKFSWFESVFNCNFTDVADNNRCRLSLQGDWRGRRAVIYLNQGNGQTLPIARIYRPVGTGRNLLLGKQDYYVDIAPNGHGFDDAGLLGSRRSQERLDVEPPFVCIYKKHRYTQALIAAFSSQSPSSIILNQMICRHPTSSGLP